MDTFVTMPYDLKLLCQGDNATSSATMFCDLQEIRSPNLKPTFLSYTRVRK